MKFNKLFIKGLCIGILLLSSSAFSVEFKESWSYVIEGRENDFSSSMPITDLCLFSADINSYGEIMHIPSRSKLPSDYEGRVHLVSTCEGRALTHMILEPQFGVGDVIISNLVAASKDFDGIQIDYENVMQKDGKNFKTFLRKLRNELPKDKMLSVCVPARTSDIKHDVYDYRGIAAYADRVFIMAYDQHWSTSEPGEVAAMDWCERIAKYAKKKLPIKKVVMGVPFYGRTWVSKNWGSAWINSSIKRIIEENNISENDINRRNGVPNFTFKTEVTVTGWYDDVESLVARCEMYKKMGYENIGFWRIGQEDREFWNELRIQNAK